MSPQDRLALAERLIDLYNAQDADGYAAHFTDEGAEASYRGAELRSGREGVREGLKKMFAEFPGNRADIRARYALGDYVVLHEEVRRAPEQDPFEVVSIYSFKGDQVDRVEFVR